MNVKGPLETVTNIATTVACVAIVVVLIRGRQTAGTAAAIATPPGVAKQGEVLPSVKGLDYGAAHKTLLMFLREDCHFCQASLPFYRQLLKSPSVQRPGVQAVALMPSDAAQSHQYMVAQGLGELRIVASSYVEFGSFKVRGTPTLIIVDARGVVQNVWVGQLDSGRERDVVKALSE